MLYMLIFIFTFLTVTLCLALCKAAAKEDVFISEVEDNGEKN